MSIAIIAPNRDRSEWLEHFRSADPNIKVEIYPDIGDPTEVKCVLVWKHPRGVLLKYPNLQLICSLGAGVDHILSDSQLPKIPITKVVDHNLSRDMSNYVISGIFNFLKGVGLQYEARKRNEWNDDHRSPRSASIGILGLGELGQDLAKKLIALEFEVHGFSNSLKSIDGVTCYSPTSGGIGLFAKAVNILVCLLPLTEATRGILNKELFNQMNQGTYLINVARGEHLVDEDLIEAIDKGQICGALLDVFHQEPLPQGHPFWSREEIMITPHIASMTDPSTVAGQIVENYHRIGTGQLFENTIDLSRGY